MNRRTLDILISARAWLADPDRWIQGASWHNADGVYTDNPAAVVQTCAIGAVALIDYDHYFDAVNQLREAMGGVAVDDFNDEHTHAEVLAAFDRAIQSSPEGDMQAGLAEPSIPIQVPAPAEEPRRTPTYPPAPAPTPEPTPAPVVPEPEREPIPA